MEAPCEHFIDLVPVEPKSSVCDECVAAGDTWVHLRLCLTCGNVGCCDASRNRHARKHWGSEGHPVIQSFEPEESWKYCFEDGVVAR